MPIFVTDDINLSTPVQGILPSLNSPRVGIQQLLNAGNYDGGVGNTLPSNPAFLALNDSTADRWKSVNSDAHTMVFSIGDAPVDYIGIAAHKGLVGKQLTITAITADANGDTIAVVVIFGPKMIISEEPIFVLFSEVQSPSTRLVIAIGGSENFDLEIGIIRAGKSVFLPRNIYVGHTPITYGRQTNKLIAMSDTSEYLGQRLVSTKKQSSVDMQNIPPLFYRNYLYRQFHLPSETTPFFWAWRPDTYPEEAGFCWLSGDMQVSNSLANGFMSLSFSMMGYSNNG